MFSTEEVLELQPQRTNKIAFDLENQYFKQIYVKHLIDSLDFSLAGEFNNKLSKLISPSQLQV